MKKLIVLFLAVLYMGAATGTTVHLHYCMEKLIGFDITKTEGEKCSNCGMKAGKDCCKDEQKLLKINTAHKASESNFQFVKLPPAVLIICTRDSFAAIYACCYLTSISTCATFSAKHPYLPAQLRFPYLIFISISTLH